MTEYVPDDLAITNIALGLIHESPIGNMDDPGKTARAARTHYPILRGAVLRRHRWNMAIRRVRLALSDDTAAQDEVWPYDFVLPVDCLAVTAVVDPGTLDSRTNYTSGSVRYKVEGYHLKTEISPCDIVYKGIPTQYEDNFKLVLAANLAIHLALAIANSAGKAQIARQLAAEYLKDARIANAIETTPEVIMANEFLNARQGAWPQTLAPWRMPVDPNA